MTDTTIHPATIYTLAMRDEAGGRESIEINDPDEAAEKAAEWCRGGEWGADGASINVNWTLIDEDGEEIDSGSETVEIEPDHESLIEAAVGRYDLDSICGADPDDHDWTSDGEGGLDENPGVWSTGGTSMTFASHCRCCGLHRTEHSTGSQRNPGEHDTVEYSMLDDEEIARHRKNGSMDEAE